jgi:LytS/YehU family sensor histidine kinase
MMFSFIYSFLIAPKPQAIKPMAVSLSLFILIFCIFLAYIIRLYYKKERSEKLIEQLKSDNLRNKYVALTNNINPHFLLNSLNGLNQLIRRKNNEKAIEYVNDMSLIFRYILQSDKKEVVMLEEEIVCLEVLRSMLEIIYEKKLTFNVCDVSKFKNLSIPVMSLLSIITNIIEQCDIYCEDKIEIGLNINELYELTIRYPIIPKVSLTQTKEIKFVQDLESRFLMLTRRRIRIENDCDFCKIYLPVIGFDNKIQV